VPAFRLAAREIGHMPKQPADRSAQHVQDVDAFGRRVDGTDPVKSIRGLCRKRPDAPAEELISINAARG
jgi:hypothetical protein